MDKEALAVLKAVFETILPVPSQADISTAEVIAKREIPHVSRHDLLQMLQLQPTDAEHMQIAVETMQSILTAQQLYAVSLVLYMLGTWWGTATLTNGAYREPFAKLSPVHREAVLLSWFQSPVGPKRAICRLFKQLAHLTLFARVPSLAWPLISYPGPPPLSSRARLSEQNLKFMSPPKSIDDVTVVDKYQVVIVGSGAGGGVMAEHLSSLGYRVLVLEKGDYKRGSNLSLLETESFKSMFERNGALASVDGGIAILAGKTFGGGTTVNWSASFVPPGYLREEWSRSPHNLTHFTSPAFQESVERACKRIGVSTANIKHNCGNQILIDGCRKLGYQVNDIPQNTGGREHECSFCNLGCPSGTKQGTMETYLCDAAKNGCEFLCGCDVRTIERDLNGKAIGVHTILKQTDDQGNVIESKLFIKANIVVVAGGSINTPALLLRSQFKNKNIGRNLRLHPVTLAAGYYPDRDISPWKGSIMTAVSHVTDNDDGHHYGSKLEVPWLHPMLSFANLPMATPPDGFMLDSEELKLPMGVYNKLRMLKFSRIAGLLALQRDNDSVSSVEIDSAGEPVVNFKLGRTDSASMCRGLEKICDIFVVTGATEVTAFIEGVPVFRRTPELDVEGRNNVKYKEFVSKIHQNQLYPAYNSSLFSAHQMGSCRLSTSPDMGACNPKGQLWECDNVWVCDASVFPTASGVNPMVTTLSCADSISRFCADYLKSKLN